MAHFVVIANDKENSMNLRLATREQHLAYLKTLPDNMQLQYGGPLQSEAGTDMIGSLLIFEADQQEHVRTFMEQDPYYKAGLFETVKITRFKKTI